MTENRNGTNDVYRNTSKLYGESTDEWATPREVLEPIKGAVDGFDLDPCSGAETNRVASTVYTEDDDGLSQPWYGTVWLNPPYSDIPPWLKKAIGETVAGDVDTVVTILPSRTATQWYQNYVPESELICFVEGCISFGSSDDTAPFGSILVAYGDVPNDLAETFESFGLTYRDEGRVMTTEQARIGTAISDL